MLKRFLCGLLFCAVHGSSQPTCPADAACLCSTDVHVIFGDALPSSVTFGEQLARSLVRSDPSVQISIYDCDLGGANLATSATRSYDDIAAAIGVVSPSGASISDCPASELIPGEGSRQVAVYILNGDFDRNLGDMTSPSGHRFEVFVTIFAIDEATWGISDVDAWLRVVPRSNFFLTENYAQDYQSFPLVRTEVGRLIAESLTVSASLGLGATSISCSLFGAATSIVTYDGVPYNFQGYGEYWLSYARTSGVNNVQVRLEPCLGPTGSSQTTCATAFAIAVDTNTLEVERIGAANRLVLRFNGELQEPLTDSMTFDVFDVRYTELLDSSGMKERDRLSIHTDDGVYEIQFLDEGALFWMIPSLTARGAVEGLCGNFNGCSLDEFVTADREGFGVTDDAEQQYLAGETYRVTEVDTLFTHRTSQRYPVRSSHSPLITASASDDAVTNAGCDLFGEAFRAACVFQLAVDSSSPLLFTAYWEACSMFCELGVAVHADLTEEICSPVCSPAALPQDNAVPFCSVLENDLGGDCAELPVADGFGFSLTAPGDSYLQYLGATFDVGDGTSDPLSTAGLENICNLALFGNAGQVLPLVPIYYGVDSDVGGTADEVLLSMWARGCTNGCDRQCFDNEVYPPSFEWNRETVALGADCIGDEFFATGHAMIYVKCEYESPFVLESDVDGRNFARSTIERPNDASALFYPSSNRGGLYELQLSVSTSCGTDTRDVDVNVVCKDPIFTVEAGEDQVVEVTALGYPEVQMTGVALDGSTPLDEAAARDGRNIEMSWVFTELPMSVFQDSRLSAGLDDLTFTRDSLGDVLLENFALPEVLYIFEDSGIGSPVDFDPLDEEDIPDAFELIPLMAPRLFDVISPSMRGEQSTFMRWQPPARGTYRLEFRVDDGCRVVSDTVAVEAGCPGCDPTGFAIVSSSEVDGALQGNDMFDLDDRDGVQIPAVNWISDNKFSVMEFSSVVGAAEVAGAHHDISLSWTIEVIDMISDNVTFRHEVGSPLVSQQIHIYEEFVELQAGSSGTSTLNVGLSRNHAATTGDACAAAAEITTSCVNTSDPMNTAGVRCCSSNQCVSVCDGDTPADATYNQALMYCANIGMQLCTLEQLTGGVIPPVASPATAPDQDAEYNAGVCCTANAEAANDLNAGACGSAAVWVLDPNGELCSNAIVELAKTDDFQFPFGNLLVEDIDPFFDVSIPTNGLPSDFLHAGRKFAYTRSVDVEQDWDLELSLASTNDETCTVKLARDPTDGDVDPVAFMTTLGSNFDTSVGTSTSFYDVWTESDDIVQLGVDATPGIPSQCQGTYRVSMNLWNQCEVGTDFIDVDVTCGAPPVAIISTVSSVEYTTSFPVFDVSGVMSYPGGFDDDALMFAWSCEGPAVCTITPTSPNSPTATVQFSADDAEDILPFGTYFVSLTVDDGCQQSTSTREVVAQCGETLAIEITQNLDDVVYDGVEFPTDEDVTVEDDGGANGRTSLFTFAITRPQPPAVPEEVLRVAIDVGFLNVAEVSSGNPDTTNSYEFQEFLALGGVYTITATANDGCQSAMATTTVNVVCPRTFDIAPFTPNDERSFSTDGGRVFLEAGITNIQCSDSSRCNEDNEYTEENREEYRWEFISWPGMDEGEASPTFDEGDVVDEATDNVYNAFSNPTGTVSIRGGDFPDSFNENGNGCSLAETENPFSCTSFIPRRPGSYELALMVFDGCHFAATSAGSHFQVTLLECSGGITTPTISGGTFTVGSATNLMATDINVDPGNGAYVTYEWVVTESPELSACRVNSSNDIACHNLFNDRTELTSQFTPDVEGRFEVVFIVHHYLCGEIFSDALTIQATCDDPSVPINVQSSTSQWVRRTPTSATSSGHFPFVTVGVDDPASEPLSYWWTIISAPSGSIYEPQCYTGNSDRNRPGDAPSDDPCPQTTIVDDIEDDVELAEGSASDATAFARSRLLPSAQADIVVPSGHTGTVKVNNRITETIEYQSYVQLATPVSGVDRSFYRGYFFPDLAGAYTLELRVDSEACGYSIVGTTTVQAICAVINVIGEPTVTEIGAQGRYQLDASTFVDENSDGNLVYWWDWLPPQYDSDVSQEQIIFEEAVFLTTQISNNDRPIASFRPTMAGQYRARVIVTNGCDTQEATVVVNHDCATSGNFTAADQINLEQIAEGAAGVSEMLVDLEPLVPTLCGESYRWEVVNYNEEFIPLSNENAASGATSQVALSIASRVTIVALALAVTTLHVSN